MLLNRQKRLLAFLDAMGGEATHVDFQKLLLLYSHAAEKPDFDFVPCDYGGFSFTSHADKRMLVAKGLLGQKDHWWILTEAGAESAAMVPGHERKGMVSFFQGKSRLRGDTLIAETYRRFPYYASRSKIASRILKDDPEALASIDAVCPAPGIPGISTIGYEGKSLEGYLNALLRDGVTLLCDVRRNPLSRKFGFSKKALSGACDTLRIRYAHIPQLGIASEDRRKLHSRDDYESLFSAYRRNSLPNQAAALETIQNWVLNGERVGLTCYEHLHHECHRHCVAEALEKTFGPEFTPRHL